MHSFQIDELMAQLEGAVMGPNPGEGCRSRRLLPRPGWPLVTSIKEVGRCPRFVENLRYCRLPDHVCAHSEDHSRSYVFGLAHNSCSRPGNPGVSQEVKGIKVLCSVYKATLAQPRRRGWLPGEPWDWRDGASSPSPAPTPRELTGFPVVSELIHHMQVRSLHGNRRLELGGERGGVGSGRAVPASSCTAAPPLRAGQAEAGAHAGALWGPDLS